MLKRSPKVPRWQNRLSALRSFSVPKEANKLSRKKNVDNEVRTPLKSSTLDCTSITCSWLTSDDEDDGDFSELSDFCIDEEECTISEFYESSALSIEKESRNSVSKYSSPSKPSKVWDSESSVDFSKFVPKNKSTPLKKKTPANALKEDFMADNDHGGSFIPKMKEQKSLLDLEVRNIPPASINESLLDLDENFLHSTSVDVAIPENSVNSSNSLDSTIEWTLMDVAIPEYPVNENNSLNTSFDSTLVNVVIPEKSLNESNSLNTTNHSKTRCSPKTLVQEQGNTSAKKFKKLEDQTFNRNGIRQLQVDERKKRLRNVPICELVKPPKEGYVQRKSSGLPTKIIYRRDPSDLKNVPVCPLSLHLPSQKNLRSPGR